jgi:hypothetical protein
MTCVLFKELHVCTMKDGDDRHAWKRLMYSAFNAQTGYEVHVWADAVKYFIFLYRYIGTAVRKSVRPAFFCTGILVLLLGKACGLHFSIRVYWYCCYEKRAACIFLYGYIGTAVRKSVRPAFFYTGILVLLLEKECGLHFSTPVYWYCC